MKYRYLTFEVDDNSPDYGAYIMLDQELVEWLQERGFTPDTLDYEDEEFSSADWTRGEFLFGGGLRCARSFAKRWFPPEAEYEGHEEIDL